MLTHITNAEWRTRHGGRSEVIKWKQRESYDLHETVIKKLGYYSHAKQVQHSSLSIWFTLFCLTPTKLAPIGQYKPEFSSCLSLLTERWYGYKSPCCLCDFWTSSTIFVKHGMKILPRPRRPETFNFPQPVITIWRTILRCDTSATIYGVAYGINFWKNIHCLFW
jgi:hypothetical protein